MKRYGMIFLGVLLSLALVSIAYQTLPDSREKPGVEEMAQGKVFPDYSLLRESFRSLAQKAGATLEAHEIAARGPQGEALFIDIAYLGNRNAQKTLLHISGVHGVEGYIGSTIQSVLLKRGIKPTDDVQIIFIHALNPYGMAFHRRVNESNVDINRNAIFSGQEDFVGTPEAYKKVHAFLNPPGPPSRIDMFYPLAAWNILRHGFVALKQAIGGGQYDYPQGLYFGGKKNEESTLFLKEFLERHLAHQKKLYVLEVHTGLGKWGKDVLFWALPQDDEKTLRYSQDLGETLSSDEADKGVGFQTPGDLQKEMPKLIPHVDSYWILQEFGAYGPVPTLRALRDENRYHQNAGRDVAHWSKKKLIDAFSPADKGWQEMTVKRGVELFDKVLKVASSE